MTREESIDRLRKISEKTPICTNGDDLVAITMAIQALSQEPCDDAISRDAVKQAINCWIGSGEYRYAMSERFLIDRINDLPPVTQKSGKWIMSDDGLYRPICDKCGAHPWKGYIPTVEEATEVFKYCPNCGAEMEREE